MFALSEPTFSLIWVGTLAFAVQIYADFSAYSDIARGTGRLLGFELMTNFDHPYLADGPADFWRRWHISLSSWFRDYVYVPLGGNRGSRARTSLNVLVTFVLSGFWHGASWNFVFWGAYHGTLLVAYRWVDQRARALTRAPTLRPLRVLVTFALVNVGWLMFRETDTRQLLADLSLSPLHDSADALAAAAHLFALTVLYASPLLVNSSLELFGVYRRAGNTRGWALSFGVTAAALAVLTSAFYSTVPSDFIYFRF